MQAFKDEHPVSEMEPVPQEKEQFEANLKKLFDVPGCNNVKFFSLTPTQQILFKIKKRQELKAAR